MANQNSETDFLDFLKHADAPTDVAVRTDENEDTDTRTEAAQFSDVARESNQEGREDQPGRLLEHKRKSDVAERALVGAVLNMNDFETSNIQISPNEKVSHPRSVSLMETVVRKCGRL